MRCTGQLPSDGNRYCTKCQELHKACVLSVSTKLIGMDITWSTLPTNPMVKVMTVTANPHLAITELNAKMCARRLRRTMACNNAACNHTPTLTGNGTALHFDSCHSTATFRGWLCNRCNIALGLFRDDGATITRAREALRIAAQKPQDRAVIDTVLNTP